MNPTPNYRHELKYQISKADHYALRQRLQSVMKRDPHTRQDGLYVIRSVYFDNFRDKALREKIDGVQLREKFRIRYYNDDLSFITLEKKIKHNDLCMKIDARITNEERSVRSRRRCRSAGRTTWILHFSRSLITPRSGTSTARRVSRRRSGTAVRRLNIRFRKRFSQN